MNHTRSTVRKPIDEVVFDVHRVSIDRFDVSLLGYDLSSIASFLSPCIHRNIACKEPASLGIHRGTGRSACRRCKPRIFDLQNFVS